MSHPNIKNGALKIIILGQHHASNSSWNCELVWPFRVFWDIKWEFSHGNEPLPRFLCPSRLFQFNPHTVVDLYAPHQYWKYKCQNGHLSEVPLDKSLENPLSQFLRKQGFESSESSPSLPLGEPQSRQVLTRSRLSKSCAFMTSDYRIGVWCVALLHDLFATLY